MVSSFPFAWICGPVDQFSNKNSKVLRLSTSPKLKNLKINGPMDIFFLKDRRISFAGRVGKYSKCQCQAKIYYAARKGIFFTVDGMGKFSGH
jgi:hypothetical protein